MRVLVTGGAGYIGCHAVLQLMEAGHEAVVVDSLVNSHREAVRRVEALAGRPVPFHHGDIRDSALLDAVFAARPIDAVMHFAGLKAVGESVAIPLAYYDANVGGTLCLVQAMARHGVRRLVFSSSATVYGEPETLPIPESHRLRATNPYGRTKLMIEEILRDLHASDPSWGIVLLRYFNPVGAHESGLIGEDPRQVPNNLMPFVAQVAGGRRDRLRVFGGDYPTHDGTGVRDFIHVQDLAAGHLKALDHLARRTECLAINLGTGAGYSVLDLVAAFRRASGRDIPYEIVARRPGDVAVSFADPTLARTVLGWTARRSLDEMCRDGWNWQANNPRGYEVP